jgi:hypothetical protein
VYGELFHGDTVWTGRRQIKTKSGEKWQSAGAWRARRCISGGRSPLQPSATVLA